MTAFALALLLAAPPVGEKFDDTGFVPIFNGKDLTGWHVSAKTGHSGTTKNKSGGRWVAEDGAIVGSQDVPGNGGIVITDKHYTDFEVALEMRNDDGPDSGLFLRSTEDGKCYQAMIDYHKGGNLMGVYGEGIGGKPNERNFDFIKDSGAAFPFITAKGWLTHHAIPEKDGAFHFYIETEQSAEDADAPMMTCEIQGMNVQPPDSRTKPFKQLWVAGEVEVTGLLRAWPEHLRNSTQPHLRHRASGRARAT